MKNILLKSIVLFLAVYSLCGINVFGQEQEKVANFSTGKYGTKSYEHLSFSANENGRGNIIYSYNKSKDIELTYLGADTTIKDKSFKIQFPNNLVLKVTPSGDALKVTNEEGTYLKYFRWEYEGPINGIGTSCNICTEDGKEAVALVKRYFLID